MAHTMLSSAATERISEAYAKYAAIERAADVKRLAAMAEGSARGDDFFECHARALAEYDAVQIPAWDEYRGVVDAERTIGG